MASRRHRQAQRTAFNRGRKGLCRVSTHRLEQSQEVKMTSGRAIDHVVLAVRDLARVATTYEALGFTLTPRASHEDRMGTSNRLAQFKAKNFIELLEVDRPDRLARHGVSGQPPFFSFGDHNPPALAQPDGLSMLRVPADN